jgi:hypothetical protein
MIRLATVAVVCVAVTATVAAGAVARVPVFGGCTSKVRVRPHNVTFACADGNFYATGLRWTRWDAREATAAGTGHRNDCSPNCAAGHFHAYPLTVTLSRPLVCAGFDEFSRVAWRFGRAGPTGVPRAGSESFSCRWRKLRPR